jgi:hypothetical protein
MLRQLINDLNDEDRKALMLAFNDEEPFCIKVNEYYICVHTEKDNKTIEECGDWSLRL